MRVVDCFPFFAPYGEEILYLRVNLLKDVVDNFIIVESNKTHNGKPVERKFLEIAQKQGLPMEKIIYIEHDIPETEDLEITKLDRMNAGEQNANNLDSLYSRVRERLQKDAVMQALDQFDDNDVFLYGDADEIIKPQNVRWVAEMARAHQHVTLKIPLVYLQGRADLRVYQRDDRGPAMWWRGMFFATKAQLKKFSVNRIRCGATPLPVKWPTQDNVVIQDMGWHFAWMGDRDQRKTKATSFAHAHDNFDWLGEGTQFNEYWTKHNNDPVEGGIAPDGNPNHFLMRYPIEELPSLLLETDFVREFLMPETKITDDYQFNPCECFWCNKLEYPLLYNLDGDKYWFEIPRCGTVTIKESYPNRKKVFRTDDEYDEIKSKPAVVISDPLERFISTLNAYLTPKQRYYHYGKDMFEAFSVDLDECTKEEKVELFFRNIHKMVTLHQVHHFHPQTRFIDTNKFKKFTVVKREEINSFFGTPKHMNETVKDITIEDLSPEQIEFVKRIYKSDYEFIKKHG